MFVVQESEYRGTWRNIDRTANRREAKRKVREYRSDARGKWDGRAYEYRYIVESR